MHIIYSDPKNWGMRDMVNLALALTEWVLLKFYSLIVSIVKYAPFSNISLTITCFNWQLTLKSEISNNIQKKLLCQNIEDDLSASAFYEMIV